MDNVRLQRLGLAALVALGHGHSGNSTRSEFSRFSSKLESRLQISAVHSSLPQNACIPMTILGGSPHSGQSGVSTSVISIASTFLTAVEHDRIVYPFLARGTLQGMATKTIVTYACDLCESEPATRYKIGLPNHRTPRNVDLCTKHAKPIHDLMERVGGARSPKPTKKAAKATPPKKAAAAK